MDYWLQRCSICFDAQLDLCLEYCRDQYCLECFRRYVTEVVTSSWGLSVTKIRCPVCQDPIPQSEWSKFVPSSVVEHYNRYNQPYRSFSRCCPNCETEVIPCNHQDTYYQGGPNRVSTMLKELIQSNHTIQENNVEKQNIQQLLPMIERQDWNNSTLPHFYQQIILAVMAFEQKNFNYMTHNDEIMTTTRRMMEAPQSPQPQQQQQEPQLSAPSILNNIHDSRMEMDKEVTMSHKNALAISKTMLLFDMKPDTWRKLQFQHIGFFSNVDCPKCLVTFCLQCGQREHANLTCEESMQKIVDNNYEPIEFIETVRWQLKNSRRCPNCSIMINRDEGCNKVDCSLCGFCFCWACRSPWSEKCGFYHCVEANAEQLALHSPELSEAQTELGVPNVSSIQARLFSIT
ncbi:hypothetical protein BDC45DRAFT_505572 [Circinella umbellata]|nr:hypothetical protein BDC45DRAFT_505572 [Circinella umbellata]